MMSEPEQNHGRKSGTEQPKAAGATHSATASQEQNDPFEKLTPPRAGGKVPEESKLFSPPIGEQTKSFWSKLLDYIPATRDLMHLKNDIASSGESPHQKFNITAGTAIFIGSTVITIAAAGGFAAAGGLFFAAAGHTLFHASALKVGSIIIGGIAGAGVGTYLGLHLARSISDGLHMAAKGLNKVAAEHGSYWKSEQRREIEALKTQHLEQSEQKRKEGVALNELVAEGKAQKDDPLLRRRKKDQDGGEDTIADRTKEIQGVGGNATGVESLDPLNKFGTGFAKKPDECK